MTRTSKSYRSTAQKEPKETKAQKLQRIENYRQARVQAKKFVLPGVIAILAIVFFFFGAKYGFRGSKPDKIQEKIVEAVEKHSNQQPTVAQEQLTNMILEALKKFEKKPDDPSAENNAQEPILNPEGLVDQEIPVSPDSVANEEL